MAQPVTTTDLLLQEVAGLLTEIRDLLRERPADTPSAGPAAASPAVSKPAKRAAKKT